LILKNKLPDEKGDPRSTDWENNNASKTTVAGIFERCRAFAAKQAEGVFLKAPTLDVLHDQIAGFMGCETDHDGRTLRWQRSSQKR
jgi:hypothetical protein